MPTKRNTTTHTATDNVEPINTHKQTMIADAIERLSAAQDDVLASFNVPTGRRLVVAAFTALCTTGTTYYVGLQLLNAIVVAAIALTGTGFIAFMISFVGLCLAMWGAMYVGFKTFGAVVELDVPATKAKLVAAKDKVVGFFNRKPLEVANA